MKLTKLAYIIFHSIYTKQTAKHTNIIEAEKQDRKRRIRGLYITKAITFIHIIHTHKARSHIRPHIRVGDRKSRDANALLFLLLQFFDQITNQITCHDNSIGIEAVAHAIIH